MGVLGSGENGVKIAGSREQRILGISSNRVTQLLGFFFSSLRSANFLPYIYVVKDLF